MCVHMLYSHTIILKRLVNFHRVIALMFYMSFITAIESVYQLFMAIVAVVNNLKHHIRIYDIHSQQQHIRWFYFLWVEAPHSSIQRQYDGIMGCTNAAWDMSPKVIASTTIIAAICSHHSHRSIMFCLLFISYASRVYLRKLGIKFVKVTSVASSSVECSRCCGTHCLDHTYL